MPITVSVWSQVDLPDPGLPTPYYFGYKAPNLLRAGPFPRALSARTGEHSMGAFDVEMIDLDPATALTIMRTKLAGATSKYIMNRTMIVRTILDEQRRLLMTPRIVSIGIIRDYDPVEDYKFTFKCEEYLAKFTGLGRDDKQIPKRTLQRAQISDLPTGLIGKPVPIIYGDCSSQASATPAPKINLLWADGGFYNTNVEGSGAQAWHAGWGTVSPASTAAIPAGLSVTNSGGGSIMVGDSLLNIYNVAVTAVDGSGNETDPIYFNWHRFDYPYSTTITSDNRKIDVSWAAAAGAVGYRVYLGYGGVDQACQRIQTASTSCSFDRVPKQGTLPTTATIATGAELIEFAESWLYAVSAVMADGETVLSPLIYGKSQGYRRPLKLDWAAVPSVINYYVYRRKVQVKGINGATEDSIWDRRWTVAAGTTTFSDDLLDTGATIVSGGGPVNGAVPLVFCGMATSLVDGSRWHRYLVCGHAVKSIKGVFIDNEPVDASAYGVQACIPGQTGYTSFFPNTGPCPFTDLGGQRFTFCYGRGPVSQEVAEGKRKAYVNVEGIESAGDSTGVLLNDIFDQYKHFMRNWVLQDYQTGGWFGGGSPLWPDVTPILSVLDDASFDRCKAIGLDRIPTLGYRGAGMIGGEGAQHTTKEIVRRWNLSSGAYSCTNHRSQFSVKMIDLTGDGVDDSQQYSESHDIDAGSFKVTDVVNDLENVIPYVYRRNFGRQQWLNQGERSDSPSQTNNQETKRGQQNELWFVTDGAQAQNVMDVRLAIYKDAPRICKFKTTLYGMNNDLGDFIRVTHREGIGVTGTGWVDQPCFIIRHTFDADTYGVEIQALDVSRLIA